jgi:uncharacterized protein
MEQAADLYARKEKDLHIYTCKGRQFFLSHPTFDIEEIAHATAMQCRYTGHTNRFYSVAEHAVLVADILDWNAHPELAYEGLMHDAHEAYVSDIASPWKVAIPDYRRVEEKLEAAMREWAHLPSKISSEVKRADWLALFIEAEQLLWPGVTKEWLEPEVGMKETAHQMRTLSARFIVAGYDPNEANNAFLARYYQLQRRRANVAVA